MISTRTVKGDNCHPHSVTFDTFQHFPPPVYLTLTVQIVTNPRPWCKVDHHGRGSALPKEMTDDNSPNGG